MQTPDNDDRNKACLRFGGGDILSQLTGLIGIDFLQSVWPK